ncbi:GNAT family N-acetyltransferase [Lacticaseibacillus jixiensis]|uniref:GNAT family N-acetyltransferase n=1 Tax=Lacticaseibacillus jixiensis TaxID=3231926 RepID=UPI0036F30B17
MQIEPYHDDPKHLAELVDLILYCQNTEAHLNIKMADQPDVFAIAEHYQAPGGNFWLALEQQHVVGCIGLLPVTPTVAVLKKFFVDPEFRGQPHVLGWQLYQTLLTAAKAQGIKRLVLDTPEAEHRSHRFYERQGFIQCQLADLGVTYAFPDRQSRFYQLTL